MKIFICASKHLYNHIPPIKEFLELAGHTITLPNSYDEPMREFKMKEMGVDEHRKWKAEMLNLQGKKIAENDAILVINMEKNGQKNYIGGATFLEIFKAFELGKKIFLYNDIPDSFIRDELLGIGPIVIHGDLKLVE